jgi:hypothetical protein
MVVSHCRDEFQPITWLIPIRPWNMVSEYLMRNIHSSTLRFCPPPTPACKQPPNFWILPIVQNALRSSKFTLELPTARLPVCRDVKGACGLPLSPSATVAENRGSNISICIMMHSAIFYATPLTSIAMSLWSICVTTSTIPSSGPKSPPHQNRVFSIHLDHIQISILHQLRCHYAAQQTSPVPPSPFVIYSDPRMAVISRACVMLRMVSSILSWAGCEMARRREASRMAMKLVEITGGVRD